MGTEISIKSSSGNGTICTWNGVDKLGSLGAKALEWEWVLQLFYSRKINFKYALGLIQNLTRKLNNKPVQDSPPLLPPFPVYR